MALEVIIREMKYIYTEFFPISSNSVLGGELGFMT